MKRKPNPKPPAASAEKTIEVEFVYESPTAKEVYLAGDFNNWSCSSLPMRQDEKGVWRLRVPLTPGRHEYRYIVDGGWHSDPCACDYVPNPFGSCNCVLDLPPISRPETSASHGVAAAPKKFGGSRAEA